MTMNTSHGEVIDGTGINLQESVYVFFMDICVVLSHVRNGNCENRGGCVSLKKSHE